MRRVFYRDQATAPPLAACSIRRQGSCETIGCESLDCICGVVPQSPRHIHRLTEPETIPRLAQPCYKRVCEDLS